MIRAVWPRGHLLAAGTHYNLRPQVFLRGFAEKKAEQTVLPGSQSAIAPNVATNSTLNSTSSPPASSIPAISPAAIPRTPPPPPTASAAQPSSLPPRSNPTPTGYGTGTPNPAPPPRKRRRFRRFLLLLTATLGLSYAGGVYYSLVSDNFHDFFTEYIPYGEEAVLIFEEREYRRRFGDRSANTHKLYPQTSGENKITVSGKSGVSARITEDKKDTAAVPKTSSTTALDPRLGTTDRAVANPVKDKKPPTSSPKSAAPSKQAAENPKKDAEIKKVDKPADKPTPPPPAPIAQIDLLKVDNATDPVVQTATKMLNDLIAVINADNASGKYSSAMAKAKDDIAQLSSHVSTYRAAESKAAEEKIKSSQMEFDKGAQQLMKRIEQEQQDQELKWREEYETERENLSKTYEDKLKAEIEAAQKVADQRLRNELLEQNLKLNDGFRDAVRSRVEQERDARLSKIQELDSAVSELSGITSKWGDVVDANLKTQHLVVAVDAVRSALENADRPKPFLHELAALKEIANDDSVVNAAIASINPAAYQYGVLSPAQLIDRFRTVAVEVRKAALLPEDAGVASHAASFVLSKLMFKKQGRAIGSDVESILTRAETLLEEGSLDEATREMNALDGWAKVLSKDWVSECRRVLEVRQALDVMSTEAKLQTLLVQ